MTLNTNTQEKKQHNKNKKKRSLLNQSIYEYSYSLYFHSINTYSIRPYDTLYSLRTLNFKEILDISQLKKKKSFQRGIWYVDALFTCLTRSYSFCCLASSASEALRKAHHTTPHHVTSHRTASHRIVSPEGVSMAGILQVGTGIHIKPPPFHLGQYLGS